MTYHLLQKSGNTKIDRSVCTTSIMPGPIEEGGSCVNCCNCWKTCYCHKSMWRPTVRGSWTYGYALAKNDPEAFTEQMIYELSHTRKDKARVHAAGDFFNARYVDAWHDIATVKNDKYFWTYTKAWDWSRAMNEALTRLDSLPNFNIVRSLYKGSINYGTDEYIHKLAEQIQSDGHQVFICPCGYRDVKCGKECTACAVYKYVLFLQH